MSLKWSNEKSVYLPEIDAEHRGLYRNAAELQKAIVAGGKPADIKPILVDLLEAAEEHFRHEERLMRVVHYAAFEWHKRQHDTVRKRLKEAIKGLDAGDGEACNSLVPFFSKWIGDHLAVTDRMMGAFISELPAVQYVARLLTPGRVFDSKSADEGVGARTRGPPH